MGDCVVCGTPEYDKPMCFQGERWCSDDCRKLVLKEINDVTFTIVSGKAFNPETGLFDRKLNEALREKERKRENNRRVQAQLGK